VEKSSPFLGLHLGCKIGECLGGISRILGASKLPRPRVCPCGWLIGCAICGWEISTKSGP